MTTILGASRTRIANRARPVVCMLARESAFQLPPSRRMAEALVGTGLDVRFYYGASTSAQPELVEGVSYARLYLNWRERVHPLRRAARELVFGWRFIRSAAAIHADLFFAHNIGAIPWIAMAAWFARRPWVYQAHEFITRRDRVSPINRFYLVLEWLLARYASLVICPEPNRARLMEQALRLPTLPTVVRNAMPLTPHVRNDRLRCFLKSEGGGKGRIVLYQGGYGLTPIMTALIASVRYWQPDDDLVLIGWSSEQAQRGLKDLVAQHGLSKRVHFHESVPHADLWSLVCGADIGLVLYANTSSNERYAAPNKLGEYLMAGLPVAYTRCEGMDGVLGGQPFAQCVDPVTPEVFAQAIGLLADSSFEARRRLARDFALRSYNYAVQFAGVGSRILSLVLRRETSAREAQVR